MATVIAVSRIRGDRDHLTAVHHRECRGAISTLAPGLVSHTCLPHAEGLTVVDVWVSLSALRMSARYSAQHQLWMAAGAVDVELRLFPVHRTVIVAQETRAESFACAV